MGNCETKVRKNTNKSKEKCVEKNEQNGREDRDIEISLITSFEGEKTYFRYNISEFLRQHKSNERSDNRISKANEFVRLLDGKVHVSASDSRYRYIYEGIDTIVHRLVEELGKVDPFFKYTKLRKTGSISSDVKVGLPHEADYVLELPKNKTLSCGTKMDGQMLYDMINAITEEKNAELTMGLDHWVIYGIKSHRHIEGICLIMECQSDSPRFATVGVTVDIVPVYVETETEETYNEKARAFLPYSLQEYAQREELYRLVNKDACDTGLIENAVMKGLPDDIKRPFRVVKFLLQNLVTTRFISFKRDVIIEEDLCRNLYGYKPFLPSYQLRVIFLHLLLGIQGTEAEKELKGGLLALCLLDMLKQMSVVVRIYSGPYYACLYHPLIEQRVENFPYCLDYITIEQWDRILRYFETENAAEVVDKFKLLNDMNDEKSFVAYYS